MRKRGGHTFGTVLVGTLMLLSYLGIESTSASASAKPVKVAIVSCSSVRLVRPTRYTLGCGNGGYVLSGITWTSWGLRTAAASATYTLNTCVPTCAARHDVSYQATVTASNIQKTTKGNVYRRILLVYQNHGRPARVLWTLPSQ